MVIDNILAIAVYAIYMFLALGMISLVGLVVYTIQLDSELKRLEEEWKKHGTD